MRYQLALNWFAMAVLFSVSAVDAFSQEEQKVTTEQLKTDARIAWLENVPRARLGFSHASVAKSMKCTACHRVDDTLLYRRAAEDLQYEVSGLKVSANPLGIQATSLSPEFANYLGLNQSAVVAREVPENSPAYQAGLRQYDVILSANETKLESPSLFDELVTAQSGKQLVLTILRRGEQKQIELIVPSVVATVNAENGALAWIQTPKVQSTAYRLGVVLAAVDDVLHSHLNLPKGEGILVTEVTKEGPADRIGCEVNDIFLAIDGKPITSQDQLRSLVQEIGDREVVLKLVRRGKSIETKIKPTLMNNTESTNSDFVYGNLLDMRLVDDAHTRQKYWRAIYGDALKTNPEEEKPSENVTQIQKVKAKVVELRAKMMEVLVELEAIETDGSTKKTP